MRARDFEGLTILILLLYSRPHQRPLERSEFPTGLVVDEAFVSEHAHEVINADQCPFMLDTE